jgi:sugar/nucleoside kinase (ribokinase family)
LSPGGYEHEAGQHHDENALIPNAFSDTAMIYLIGNTTRDLITIKRHTVKFVGGTVWYAALFLLKLGRPVAVVGHGDPEIRRLLARHGADVRHLKTGAPVAVFENIYASGGRRQLARPGRAILPGDVPAAVSAADAVLAGPVLQEIDPAIFKASRTGLMMLDGQGILRHLQSDGRVTLRMTPTAAMAIGRSDILKVDAAEAAVIAETEDVTTALRRLHQLGPQIVIITRGERGVCLFDGYRVVRMGAPAVNCIDPTGAGDVFDAAFLVRFVDARDLLTAGRFAVAAAALSTRGFGVSALPSKSEIEGLVAQHFKQPMTVHIEEGGYR